MYYFAFFNGFKDACNKIDINLRDILGIDEERMIVKVEPRVDMGYITRYLLPKGYALAIQVEMEDLTIGGLCMGLGMETNSHLYGLIQETVELYEMVLSDGSLVTATRNNALISFSSKGSITVWVGLGGTIASAMFSSTKPSATAHPQKEDRVA